MNSLYGFPLFEKGKKAKNKYMKYFYNIHKIECDTGLINLLCNVSLLSDHDRDNVILISSNRNIVSRNSAYHLIPPLYGYIINRGIKCDIVTFNPNDGIKCLIDNCLETEEAFGQSSLKFIQNYFFKDFGEVTTWMELYRKYLPKDFQQYITSKYGDKYITFTEDKMIVKVISEDTFHFIYAFADDIFKYL